MLLMDTGMLLDTFTDICVLLQDMGLDLYGHNLAETTWQIKTWLLETRAVKELLYLIALIVRLIF